MSVKISGKVWDMDLPSGDKIVLLALADHADHNGKNAFPGNGLLAYKTGLSVRQVQRILEDLESRAIIKKAGGGVGRGKKASYEFNLEKMTPRPLFEHAKGDTTSTIKDIEKVTPRPVNVKQKGDIGDIEKVTLATVKGDMPRARAEERARMNRPEPSLEPSAATARARSFAAAAEKNSEEKNGNGMGAKSHFTKEVCLEYSEFLARSQNRIRNPGGFAVSIYSSGEADREIQAWIESGKQVPKEKRKGEAARI